MIKITEPSSNKAQKIEGVRRARATFIDGVTSVTFDDAHLSPNKVIEQVRKRVPH
jgi:hypothetical protein